MTPDQEFAKLTNRIGKYLADYRLVDAELAVDRAFALMTGICAFAYEAGRLNRQQMVEALAEVCAIGMGDEWTPDPWWERKAKERSNANSGTA